MIGIVILNYKNYQDTIACVNNISQQKMSSYSIYIVDNDSQDLSYEKLVEKYTDQAQIKVLQSGKNGGYSFGNNVGFRAAIEDGCDFLLCTNNDVEFYPNCIVQLEKALIDNPEVAVVGPKIYTKDGGLQKCNKAGLTPFRFLMHHNPFAKMDIFGVNKRYGMLDYNFDKPIIFEGMVSGCCFMIRSKVLQDVGFLDEGVFLYHEEDILAAKLKKHGWKTMVEPAAEIIHYGSGTIGNISPFTRYCTFSSGLYYLWHYTSIGKCGMKFMRCWIVGMFRIMSLKNKDYKQYAEKIKDEVKQLTTSVKWSDHEQGCDII